MPIVFGFVSIGFFASPGGLVIVGVAALALGTIVAAAVDPPHAARNIGVVAFYVVVIASAYILILSGLARAAPAGSRGGPGIYPPPSRGGPAVHPPQR